MVINVNGLKSIKLGTEITSICLGSTSIYSGSSSGDTPSPPAPSGDTWITDDYLMSEYYCLEMDGDSCTKYGHCNEWRENEGEGECDDMVEVPFANVPYDGYDVICPYISKVRINQDFIDGLESGKYQSRWTIDTVWYMKNGNDFVRAALCVEFYKTPNDVTYARIRFNTNDDAMMDGTDSLANPIDINGVASGLVIDFESTYGMPMALSDENSYVGLDFVLATSAPSGSNLSFNSYIDWNTFWDSYSFGCSMQNREDCDPEWDDCLEYKCNYLLGEDYDNDYRHCVMCNDCWESCCKHLWDEGDEANPWDTTQYANMGCRNCNECDCENEWNEECCGDIE